MVLVLVTIVLALLCSAFFSGSETAFVTASRLRVEARARRRGLAGKQVQNFLEDPARFLSTTLVGNNIALVVYSTLAAVLLTGPVHTFLAERAGLSAASLEVTSLVAQSLIAGSIVLLLGEILPKTIAQSVASRAVFFVALPLRLAYWILLPLVQVAMWASRRVLLLLRMQDQGYPKVLRRQFELIIEESLEKGSLDLNHEESEFLTKLFDLHDMRVKESMTPRTDIIAVDESTSVEDFRATCIECGYSKIPVYLENIDNIVGVAFARDLFDAPDSVKSIMRPAKFVPEAKSCKELLKEFRDTNSSIGIVVDEYGGTAGLITTEDLLEELFGDIQDEFDSEDVVLHRLDATTVMVSGKAEINEVNDRLSLELPEGDYETVAGYLLEQLGTIPKAQDEHDLDGYHFSIQQATQHRIDLVRIQAPSAPRKGSTKHAARPV